MKALLSQKFATGWAVGRVRLCCVQKPKFFLVKHTSGKHDMIYMLVVEALDDMMHYCLRVWNSLGNGMVETEGHGKPLIKSK